MATDVVVSRELKSLQDELSAAKTQRASRFGTSLDRRRNRRQSKIDRRRNPRCRRQRRRRIGNNGRLLACNRRADKGSSAEQNNIAQPISRCSGETFHLHFPIP